MNRERYPEPEQSRFRNPLDLFRRSKKPVVWTRTYVYAEVSPHEDAAYLHVKGFDPEVARSESLSENVRLDFGSDGSVVGVELVGLNFRQVHSGFEPKEKSA